MRSRRDRGASLHWMAAAVCVALIFACGRAPEPSEAPDGSPVRPETAAPVPSREGAAPQEVPPGMEIPTRPMAPGDQDILERLRSIERIPFEEKDPERAVAALRSHLDDPELDVREAAVMALAEVEGGAADRALAEHVRVEQDSMLKIDIVDELIDREAPQSLDTLLFVLGDTDAEVRERAADGLDEIGDERAVPALYDALRAEPDEFVQDAIRFALSSLDPDYDEDEDELDGD